MKKVLQVHLWDKCNLKCKHCYQQDINYNYFLNIESFKLLMKQFQEWTDGTKEKVINITGGEPLLITNIIDYIDEAINSGATKINLLTNGLLVDNYILKQLKDRSVFIQVSLEGNEFINNLIRGQGTYKKVLNSIKMCNEMGLNISVSVTLNGLNYNTIGELIDDVKQAGAYRIWFDRMIGNKDSQLPLITTSQFIEAMNIINVKKNQYQNNNFIISTHRALQFMFTSENNDCYKCGALIKNLTIMPNGDVYPCRRLPIKIGNFKEQSLLNIFQSKELDELRDKIHNYPNKCEICNYKNRCKGGLKCLTYSLKGDLNYSDVNCPINLLISGECK